MYSGPRRARVSQNLQSALENAEAVTADIKKEVDAGRMAGPFSHPPSANFISSPIGTVPKKGTDEVRRIHHLSHPSGSSVNDYIADSYLSYTSFDVSTSRPRPLALRTRSPHPPRVSRP